MPKSRHCEGTPEAIQDDTGLLRCARNDGRWLDALDQHRAAGLWRSHQTRLGPQPLHSFNSNDYLGMSQHPEVIKAFKEAADQYGVGSGSANTLSGYTRAHEALRETLREWLGRDDVLLFSSGYQANLAALTTLIGKEDFVLADKLNHASLNDGMRFSGARFKRYPHLTIPNESNANWIITESIVGANNRPVLGPIRPSNANWIITESIFSMNGDAINLPALVHQAKINQAILYIDEAHSLGLYGPQGAGIIAAQGFTQKEVPLMVGTFGKAIGTQGAFVAGDQTLIDALMQFGRPYLFTTALAPALAAASNVAIQLVRKADQERLHIQGLIRDFREKASTLGLSLLDSASPIQPILFQDIEQVNRLSAALSQRGIAVSSIRYPTVPLDAPRLRFTLTANHTPEMISHLFHTLKEVMDEETSHSSCL